MVRLEECTLKNVCRPRFLLLSILSGISGFSFYIYIYTVFGEVVKFSSEITYICFSFFFDLSKMR